ncbi:deubiquitinating enzyme [Coemansia sp. RSA 1821]|nr:deubiquitinating enzyme [Coemansia sp. RSA 1086]KAJ1753245.1 deubiquitinating enzyme [Coemansia sp. RSA 1821]
MVDVKWQGKKYKVETDSSTTGEDFKAQLYSLTGVAPERQKILVKGGQLKDDTVISTLGLKENQVLMMIGTVGELPKAPVQPIKFVEDMSEGEVAQALSIPAGLNNLGNTCYMNATLQCLKAIPELKQALDQYSAGAGQLDPRKSLVSSLKGLFNQLNESGEGVPPFVFLQFLRQANPRFAEQDSQSGGFRQQDAEEFWNEMLTILDQVLKKDDATVIEKYMSGRMATTWKCEEAPEEEPTVRYEVFRKLDCHIDKSVNYLSQGIKKGLEETVEKRSESLGRNADYQSISRIERLPEYLTVTFNRFFWKASESIDAKIVKSVKFPLDFDVAEFCTPELLEKMRPARQHLREIEDKLVSERKLAKAKQDAGSNAASKDVEMAEGSSSAPFELHPDLKADVGCNPTGVYELIGVVTHIGRTANSGHYMAWVRKEKGIGGPDPAGKGIPETQHWWYKFDDDDVTMVTDEEILKLCGGGDWHTAYVALYRAKKP